MDKLRQHYRLVIMNDETFEEQGSYKLTLLNVYLAISTLIVGTAFLVMLLMAFTPLRRFIPGYGDANKTSELIKLNEEIDALKEELDAQRLYADNFRRMLIGDYETEPDKTPVSEEIPDSLLNVPRIEEDEHLRQEIEMDEKIQEQALLSRTVNFVPKDRPLGQMFFISPIRGQISAGFMPDKKHNGLDVMAPKGTPVKAIMDGYIISSDWTLETGNTIGIQHGGNLISFYKHNSTLLKDVGDYVKAGEAIAIIGNTGTLSNGPHLHFELWYKGKPVDPKDYILF